MALNGKGFSTNTGAYGEALLPNWMVRGERVE